MKRILVVDGDTGVRARIAKHARMEGYDVTEAGDGETALSLSRQQNAFDLMVLAVNLPGMDGFTVLKAVRTFSAIPVLILSSKNTAEDRIHGLELGADDYMTKPFSARELLLRISAILKRCSTLASEEAEVLRSGGLVLDLTARRVEVDGRQINLTPREFDLLTVLMSHPDVASSPRTSHRTCQRQAGASPAPAQRPKISRRLPAAPTAFPPQGGRCGGASRDG